MVHAILDLLHIIYILCLFFPLIEYAPFAPSKWNQWVFNIMHTCLRSARSVQAIRITIKHLCYIQAWVGNVLGLKFMLPLLFLSDNNWHSMWWIPVLDPPELCRPFERRQHGIDLSKRVLVMLWLYSTCPIYSFWVTRMTVNLTHTCLGSTSNMRALWTMTTHLCPIKAWAGHVLAW